MAAIAADRRSRMGNHGIADHFKVGAENSDECTEQLEVGREPANPRQDNSAKKKNEAIKRKSNHRGILEIRN